MLGRDAGLIPDEADAPGVGGQLSGSLRRHRVRRVEHRASQQQNVHKNFFAEPDLGSGMEKNLDSECESGMNIPDYFSESLETIFLVINMVPKFFDADPDRGWETFGYGINIPDPQH